MMVVVVVEEMVVWLWWTQPANQPNSLVQSHEPQAAADKAQSNRTEAWPRTRTQQFFVLRSERVDLVYCQFAVSSVLLRMSALGNIE